MAQHVDSQRPVNDANLYDEATVDTRGKHWEHPEFPESCGDTRCCLAPEDQALEFAYRSFTPADYAV